MEEKKGEPRGDPATTYYVELRDYIMHERLYHGQESEVHTLFGASIV